MFLDQPVKKTYLEVAYRHYFCIDFDRDVNMSWLQTRDDFFGGGGGVNLSLKVRG